MRRKYLYKHKRLVTNVTILFLSSVLIACGGSNNPPQVNFANTTSNESEQPPNAPLNDSETVENMVSEEVVPREPVYLDQFPDTPVIDPPATAADVDVATTEFLNSMDEFLVTVIGQFSVIHQTIGAGLPTTSDPDLQQNDINTYNELVDCSPEFDETSVLTSFNCGAVGSVSLKLQHQDYTNVTVYLDEYDRTKGAFGRYRFSMSQAGWRFPSTPTFVSSFFNMQTYEDFPAGSDLGGVQGDFISIERNWNNYKCTFIYNPFNFVEPNVNACAATINYARSLIDKLNTTL